jgi:LmbE family N-acetylglucosaminyl deacetylase
MNKKVKAVAIIVAHPDDETLWAGATILQHPTWEVFILSLCRANDEDRATKFFKVLKKFKANGLIKNLDDEPEQIPLAENLVEQAIFDALPHKIFDLVITHNPNGEYTKHLRHEEVSKAVIMLWHKGKICTNELWTFAYEDGNKAYLPKAIEDAPIIYVPSRLIWQTKYEIITNIYGFSPESWEAQTTPKKESFWQFHNSTEAFQWLESGGQKKHESISFI